MCRRRRGSSRLELSRAVETLCIGAGKDRAFGSRVDFRSERTVRHQA